MRFIGLIIVFYCSVQFSIAQSNLVLNPSFENSYDTCWPSIGGFDYGQVDSWSSPNHSTPDYFAPLSWDGFGCSTVGSFTSPPINVFGFEYAHKGECYGGFMFMDAIGGDFHEYIQASFISPLILGKSYGIECYISLAEYSTCTSNLGFYFSDTLVSIYDGSIKLPLIPQYENPTTNLITLHAGWQRITGIYTAHGGERYMSIGNFHENNMVNRDACISSGGVLVSGSSYFYIDDVAVYDTANIDTIHLCSNDSVQLGGAWRHSAGLYIDTVGGLPVKFYIDPRPESASLTVIDLPFAFGDSVKAGYIWVKDDTIVEVPKHNIYGCDSTVRYVCRTNVAIGTQLNEGVAWSVYPNPANDFLQIIINKKDITKYNITIIDISGRKVLSPALVNDKIDISALEGGMYFVRFSDKKGNLIGTNKFVKE